MNPSRLPGKSRLHVVDRASESFEESDRAQRAAIVASPMVVHSRTWFAALCRRIYERASRSKTKP